MNTKDFLGSGWAFPVEPAGGRIRMVADEDDIRRSIELILSTAPGERVMNPDFGCEINEMVFAPQNATTYNLVAFYVREALEKWEPRIVVDSVVAAADPGTASLMLVSIDYLIRSKNQRANLVYPFYLQQEV